LVIGELVIGELVIGELVIGELIIALDAPNHQKLGFFLYFSSLNPRFFRKTGFFTPLGKLIIPSPFSCR